MEIMATNNNHNQNELRLYAPNEQQQTANSTTSLASGARSPFQREVREWQRIDPDTGALLTGRLEADRWINGPLNKYGKISDSQNISQPNGTQQTHRKQLEVLQTCTAAGGAVQVIRSQTVQTTSSRWSTSSASPLLLSASSSPIPQQQLQLTKRHNEHNFIQTAHKFPIAIQKANNTTTSASSFSPSAATNILTNGFNHKPHHLEQLQQYPHSLVNGISSSRHRNWPDLNENMSTLHICDNDHDNEHDHDSNYIVQQQSSDEEASDDNDNDNRCNLLIENNSNNNDNDNDGGDDDDQHHYLVNKRNNLKNVNATKRHSFTVFANDDSNVSNTINSINHYEQPQHHNDHESRHHHHHNDQRNNHNNNSSRDSSSGSCSNNNQLFLLDTAPSLKLSNLMKSSSSLSNSSNNSTTAAQTTKTTTSTSINTHKNMTTNKISLHAIVGSNNNTKTATTSSIPSPTFTATTIRSSWQQQASIYRQNNHNNSNNQHLMKPRVGDINNCGGSSSSDESRSYAGKTETDLRHLQRQSSNQNNQTQQQQQQQTHFKQNDRLTPTHSPHTYHHVDLESFRHYNNNENTINNNNDTDDDGLRLSARQLRRQQIPNEPATNSLQKSRSISIDDLSTDWDTQGIDGEEPTEWKRVSKLRRSFQSTTKTNQSNNSPIPARRPIDLPTSSVSVSKIRAELENGRRLNTVMRNNHVDLAALSSILDGNGEKETKSPSITKRNSFLTAESLKEIRGKLKKLSDESLYKEDFRIDQQNNDTNPAVEHIVNNQTKLKRNNETSSERYKAAAKTEELNNKHTTNSLESRLKYRDTNSTDWHLRRKSYGFEKMSPPEKAMLRMDDSTDSGLGRSGELQNWSPTAETSANNRTVVHLGETTKSTAMPTGQRPPRLQKSYEESENSLEEGVAVSKRHSIAVDESQYVRDNTRQTTQIHLNGFYEPANYSKFTHSTESTNNADRAQQKRVEFSKTEVHFATESGRVNIVETDSKPPPTNNFRRRKSRSSSVGPIQSLVNSSTATIPIASPLPLPSVVTIPVTLFGADNAKQKTLASNTVAYKAPLMDSPEPKDSLINVTVTIPSSKETFSYSESSRSSYASTSGVDTTDCDTDEMTSLKGILKNKPAKPKPYVLGENIDKPDDLWGVQLKPVSSQAKNERIHKSESPPVLTALPQKSVAERIQQLGTATLSQSNSFSTKINVNLGNTTETTNSWEESGLTINTKRGPTVQELLLYDLKEHQRLLDEGLKSTTLIMKTMRSATEFDEAMRELNMSSVKASVIKPTPILASNNSQETSQSFECTQSDFSQMNILSKSTSFSSASPWSTGASSLNKYSQDSQKSSISAEPLILPKVSKPRFSFQNNEQLPVSQQLQCLRIFYDTVAISQDDDSADEEVKSYFREQNYSDSGGGTQDSSSHEDDQFVEHSYSWSLLKARKTTWKLEADKMVQRSLINVYDKTELPKSNVMSIKLHSPKVESGAQPASPIAKPRTVKAIQKSATPKVQIATSIKQAPFENSMPDKDSLRIIKEARGARQLREHELSYFGVPVTTTEDEKPKSKYTSTSNFRSSPKRSLPLRKLNEENSFSFESEQPQQWQLENDKPDLLKHNAIEVKTTERASLKKKAELEEDEEHIYENIANDITPVFKVKESASPEHYDRKTDLQRDAIILNEMNQNADQTLRDLSDDAALKDRRRRSLHRHNTKPLETIDEKSISERMNEKPIAVKITRGTYSSEAKKTSRHSTPSPRNTKSNSRERTSSQSSLESCPRARSRSLSSEKEYDAAKSKPTRNIQMVKHKPQKLIQSRSSSLDSRKSGNSNYSSGEDQQRKRTTGSFRREDRARTKTKRITSSITAPTRDKHKEDKANHQISQQSQYNHYGHHNDTTRLVSTTHSSSHRECVECKHSNNALEATTKSSLNPGLHRCHTTTSSGRRHKDDLRESQRIKQASSSTLARLVSEHNDKYEKISCKHVACTAHSDERTSLQRSSSHRLERNEKDKEKSSRAAKGHCNRSTSHHHHDRSTDPEKHSSAKHSKTKNTNRENATSSKNLQQHNQHKSRQLLSQEHQERQDNKSKRDEDHKEHIHSLKTAIIKTTTKMREKSRSGKDKK